MDWPAFLRDHAHDGHNGISLRDYFAAKAMQGLLNKENYRGSVGVNSFEHRLSSDAYAVADAMLAAREKTP